MNRKEMIDFLSGHFRYHTMNSWNGNSSYAKNIKINKVSFPDAVTRDRAYGLLGVEEAFEDFNFVIREFAEKYNYKWQICTNGRSGGYLVLMQGYIKKSDYKTICFDCGQKNYREDTKVCGKCNSTEMHKWEGMETGIYGRGTDDDSFEDYSDEDLLERVNLVKDFDKTCDNAIEAFISFCKGNKAEEQVVMVG